MRVSMSKKRIFIYAILVVIVVLGFSIGGYIFFINSENWESARSVIKQTDVVTTRVGRVQEITTSPLGFFYRFSGDWAQVRFNLTITGEQGVALFKMEMEKSDNVWKITKIEELGY